MFSNKDYSKLTLEELMSEKRKLKSQQIPSALFIGFLVGIAVWSATHHGSIFLTTGLLVLALWAGSVYSKKQKNIEAEISRRDSVG